MLSLFLLLSATFYINSMEQEIFVGREPNFSTLLAKRMEKTNSVLCVGLDFNPEHIPHVLRDTAKQDPDLKNKDALENALAVASLISIVDSTRDYACTYKIQAAFLHKHPYALEAIVGYIKENVPDVPIIIDCKIGDIANTQKANVNYYSKLGAHAITVCAYMGSDTIKEFENNPDKTAFVVVQSSNPSGEEIQKVQVIPETGTQKPMRFWEYMLTRVMKWNVKENLMPVISANLKPEEYSWIRETIGPKSVVLVPGVGAQGGDPANCINLFNPDGTGVIFNVSRALQNYQLNDPLYYEKITENARNYRDKLNEIRSKER